MNWSRKHDLVLRKVFYKRMLMKHHHRPHCGTLCQIITASLLRSCAPHSVVVNINSLFNTQTECWVISTAQGWNINSVVKQNTCAHTNTEESQNPITLGKTTDLFPSPCVCVCVCACVCACLWVCEHKCVGAACGSAVPSVSVTVFTVITGKTCDNIYHQPQQ